MVATVVLCVAGSAAARTECDLDFSLEAWSLFYKEARGGGVVRCDDGRAARVDLETRGGGLTFGRSRIDGGTGRFSPVVDITELFGDYASAEVHAGFGASSQAQVVTKGPVSLTLSGTGNGVDLGVAFGRFTITPATGVAGRPPPLDASGNEAVGDEDRPYTGPPTDGY